MSYRGERFNRRMRSLEAMLSGYSDPSKAKVLCDGGEALERLMDALDLVAADKAYLVPTLLLVVRNGANRDESIRLSSERSYYRHRRELGAFFGVGI